MKVTSLWVLAATVGLISVIAASIISSYISAHPPFRVSSDPPGAPASTYSSTLSELGKDFPDDFIKYQNATPSQKGGLSIWQLQVLRDAVDHRREQIAQAPTDDLLAILTAQIAFLTAFDHADEQACSRYVRAPGVFFNVNQQDILPPAPAAKFAELLAAELRAASSGSTTPGSWIRLSPDALRSRLLQNDPTTLQTLSLYFSKPQPTGIFKPDICKLYISWLSSIQKWEPDEVSSFVSSQYSQSVEPIG
jgi:hypothetical protein